MKHATTTAFLTLALLLTVGLAAAQETPAAEGEGEEGSFFETVDVNLVNIDVYVTDKKGNTITGLTVDDFEVLENKRPVKVTNFFAVENGVPTTPLANIEELTELDPRTREPIVKLPEDQRLHLVVYVDNVNIRPFNRNRLFRRLREFLHDSLDSQDRVMLVSYDRSLNIRHPFTSDSNLIANALYDIETVSGHGLSKDSDRNDLLRAINEAQSLGEVEWRVRTYAESNFSDLQFTIDALNEIIESLGGLEGRKALLYVSDGLEMSPGEDLYHAMLQKWGQSYVMSTARDFNAGRRFTRLAASANENRVVFYTIDAAGLRVSSSASAAAEVADSTPGLSSFVDSVYFNNLQSPLRFMADRTGGLAIVNTNDAGPGLEKIGRDFESYYSLGYQPAHAGDGRYYRVEVKVKGRKGLRVRHREGYRDQNLYSRMSSGTTASLMYGYNKNPMDISLLIGQGAPSDKRGQFDVEVVVEIPIGEIVLIPQENFHEGRLKLFFGAMDAEGDMSDVSEVPINIRVPNDEVERALGESYKYAATLRMRTGGHRLAVGVRDEIGAVESFVTRSVNIGS